jgi:hypothetical protein
MRLVKAIAVLLAASPALAGNELPKFSAEQMACVGTATEEYLTAHAKFVLRATSNGTTLMSVDDTIAQRRLVEGYCKRRADCLVSNISDAVLREMALRAMFAECLNSEAKEDSEEIHQ